MSLRLKRSVLWLDRQVYLWTDAVRLSLPSSFLIVLRNVLEQVSHPRRSSCGKCLYEILNYGDLAINARVCPLRARLQPFFDFRS